MIDALMPTSGNYVRDGNQYKMVRRFSAQLHIPGELQYSAEENYSDMMKLVEGDSTYHTAVTHIRNTLESIKSPGRLLALRVVG
jgi:hypothetical protein